MANWNPLVEVTPTSVRILMFSGTGDELVKAELPGGSRHPRALLTLLEGLALWNGTPLRVAISADTPPDPSLDWVDAHLNDYWPEESALVQFHFLVPLPRGRRLGGVGDFRRLRRLGRSQ